MADDDDSFTIPLQDQRVFGAGVKRPRIKFVPSASPAEQTGAAVPARNASVVNQYLSTVLNNRPSRVESSGEAPSGSLGSSQDEVDAVSQGWHADATTNTVCEICRLPVEGGGLNAGSGSEKPSTGHETSIAHQYCVETSRPPSHLDRSHVGFKYLSSYGWDADTKAGLGAAGQGIPAPLKGTSKNDTMGIGLALDRNATAKPPKPKKLNAKEVRKMEARQKRSRAKMEELFYGSEDIQRYLE